MNDIDGIEIVTTALMELVNDYPPLGGETIQFSTLDADGGKAFFPTSTSVIKSSTRDILGHTAQVISYPFIVAVRLGNLSASRRVAVKEWLDNLGRWLEKQSISYNGTDYTLEDYPVLTGDRRFLSIERSTPAYLDGVNNNNTEDWAISMVAEYLNEF